MKESVSTKITITYECEEGVDDKVLEALQEQFDTAFWDIVYKKNGSREFVAIESAKYFEEIFTYEDDVEEFLKNYIKENFKGEMKILKIRTNNEYYYD